MNDWELIQHYRRNGSERAFETLVNRHVDFVYCAALRQVRDPSLAEDVSQAVFVLLAQKAKNFRSGTVLVSWLFRTTRYIASRALRSEYRRQRRELEAANMNPQTTVPGDVHDWERIAPVLDEALAALPDKDRDAVLLRFMSRKPFDEVGVEIGVSEDAAKKRVSRALGRLREFFMRRGTTLSIAAIAVMLGECVVPASPTALAAKITAGLSAGASAAASSSAGALVKMALRDFFWANVRRGAVISAGMIGVVLFLGLTMRGSRQDAATPIGHAPVAQGETSVGPGRPAAGRVNANKNRANRTLNLLVMRTEDRQPVEGARVWVDCWDWVSVRPERTLDASTDRYGALNIPIPTREFNGLVIWVSAEGRVPMAMRWHDHEFNEPVLSYALFLEAGRVVAGTVIDESGNPIQGAKVSFRGPGIDGAKRENPVFNADLSASLTDTNGRWATTQLPAQKLGVEIQVTHQGFAPTSSGIWGLPGFPTNALIVMSNGVALSGRITAADGTPIRNANVAKQSGTYLSTQTDGDGRFYWPHIEPGQLFVDVEAEGYEIIHEFVWATNAANECAFTLTQSASPHSRMASRTRARGSVVDAETGEPIANFKVLIAWDTSGAWRWGTESALQGGRLLGEGHDGRFDWQARAAGNSFRLQVEAEGYLESVSEERNCDAADEEFDFKLRRGAILVGRVLKPDGSAADDAVVSLTGPGIGPVMQAPGRLLAPNRGFEATRTQTDSDGNFRLNLKMGARGVAVLHESGSALLTFASATNHATVLQPWGAIDGTLYLNGQLAANEHIMVNGSLKSDVDPQLLLSFGYHADTDESGHFRFDKVPPGEHSVTREVGFFGRGPAIANADHTTQVTVEGGAVASVELRRKGRRVIGRIIFQGSPEEVNWGMSTAFLQGEGKFPFALSKDGTLRADDVAPGNYALSIQLERAAAGPQVHGDNPFGSLQKEATVPPADDDSMPVDLGELHITRAFDSAAAAGQMRLSASALLADPIVGRSVPPAMLVRELRDPFWGIRVNALACLNNVVLPKSGPDGLREEKETILTLVLAAAQDPQMEVRMSAVYCLGYFKEAANQAIPVLSKALTDDFPDVRVRAAMAFYKLDPVQAEKAGAITTAIDCLHRETPHGAEVLAADFLRKEGKPPPGEKQ
jgi:RNA polymerase sigma factor (sigma-70 family)